MSMNSKKMIKNVEKWQKNCFEKRTNHLIDILLTGV